MSEDGRVLIAFDDGPLEPDPTWTRVDDPTGSDFPQSFVSGFDTQNGKQSFLNQTETGTATVYINDFKYGLFDPRKSSSPYFGKLDGKQIMCQVYDPVREVWEQQFQGVIDQQAYDINPATDANGVSINASIQLDCVDIMDYCSGYGLTPGLDGDQPPNSGEDGVWYAATTGTQVDRLTQIAADIGLDESRYVFFSGNTAVQTAKYDPDESALTAFRDTAESEFPFIANLYVDRFGRLVFHGRYGRFDPEDVSAWANGVTPGRWDWHDWKVGDGKSIAGDSDRAQMRVLGFSRGRSEVINVAICYPANIKPGQMPDQVFANTTSITNYGKHAAPPMSDLLTADPILDQIRGVWDTNLEECLKFAELLVKNQKDPRENLTALQIKSLHPLDARAETTWGMLTQTDVSDVVNIKMSYPHGTGFTGTSPTDDYFVEGRTLRVRPLQPGFDLLELDLAVTARVWTSDTHNVFPDWEAP